MKLTKIERLILWNQLEIMKRLDGKTDAWDARQQVLENGYEGEYGEIAGHISDGGLNEDECAEMYVILDMAQAIQLCLGTRETPLPSGASEHQLRFRGFDGNNEGRHMGYARYLKRTGRFEDLEVPGDLNSHSRTLPKLRAQVAVWKSLGEPRDLTDEHLVALSEAR